MARDYGVQSMKTGKYRVTKQVNVAMNRMAFTVVEGREINVSQIDGERGKVLIDFGNRMIGWFHKSWLEKNASAI